MRLKDSTYRHINDEIKYCHDTLATIEEMERDIILAGNTDIRSMTDINRFPESTTERRGTYLADSTLLREMRRITRAVLEAMEELTEEQRRAIEYRYWGEGKRKKGEVVAEELHIDVSTLNRWRRRLIYAVARKLGWY